MIEVSGSQSSLLQYFYKSFSIQFSEPDTFFAGGILPGGRIFHTPIKQ